MRIYCTPIGISHVQKDLKKAYPDVNFVMQGGILDKIQTEKALLPETHIIIGSELLDEQFLAKSSLKAISRFGGSLENIDTATAKKLGIKVFSYKSSQVISDVANLTVNFVLSSSFKVFQHNAYLKQGLWNRPSYIGANAKIKILGAGNIGSLVYKRLKALDFNQVDLISMRKTVEAKNIMKNLMKPICEADVLILNASPKCWPKSQFMKCIKMTRKPLAIVNTARGSLIDEAEMHELLSERKEISYYTDVFETEPIAEKSLDLASLKNVYPTPHIGGYSKASLEEVAFKCVDFLLGQSNGT